MIRRPLLLLTFLLLTPISRSEPISLPAESLRQPLRGGFLVPNEEFPQRALPVFRSAPSGAWVAVGTERGFLAAANSPNVTHLVLIDADAGIASYNRVNTLLLKIARDRQHYLRLRLQADLQSWLQAAEAAGLSPSESEVLRARFPEWKTQVAENPEFAAFHRPPAGPRAKFGGVNYLHDDTLFERLHRMARENRIAVGQLDLADTDAVADLVRQLKANGIPLSALDISNAWWTAYLKSAKLTALLERFNEIATAASHFVTSDQPILTLLRGIVDGTRTPWRYRADTFGRIRSYASVKKFVRAFRWSSNLSLGLTSLTLKSHSPSRGCPYPELGKQR